MDIRTVWAGQVPLVADNLLPQSYALKAIATLAQQVYGSGVQALSGFNMTFSSADMTVGVAAGIVIVEAECRPTALGGGSTVGGLDADTTLISKTYLLTSADITLPSASGTYKLWATCTDSDVDATVLPFYNASEPTQTQSGSDNSGTALSTRRTSQIALTVQSATADAPTTPAGGAVVEVGTFTVPSGATTAAATTFAQYGTFWSTIPELESAITAITPGRLLATNRYTASGSYSIPAGAKKLFVRGVAGGGSGGYAVGGGDTTGATSAAGSGGAGAYVEFELDLTYGAFLNVRSIPFTVGEGGTPSGTVGYSGAGTASVFNGGDITLGAGNGGYYGALTTGTNGSPGGYGGAITYASNLSIAYTLLVEKHGAPGNPGQNLAMTNWPGLGVPTPMGTGGTNSSGGTGENAFGYGASGAGAGSGYGKPDYLGGAGAPGCWIIQAFS